VKNYLYKSEFVSGFYENCFSQQVQSENEKDAIVSAVSSFLNKTEAETAKFL